MIGEKECGRAKRFSWVYFTAEGREDGEQSSGGGRMRRSRSFAALRMTAFCCGLIRGTFGGWDAFMVIGRGRTGSQEMKDEDRLE
jgi:hypothetical protein